MVLPRNLANVAVALVVGLGSRTVAMLAIPSLIIHGPRAFRLAKVGSEETEFCAMDCVGIVRWRASVYSRDSHVSGWV